MPFNKQLPWKNILLFIGVFSFFELLLIEFFNALHRAPLGEFMVFTSWIDFFAFQLFSGLNIGLIVIIFKMNAKS
jgi:hypothetical protein